MKSGTGGAAVKVINTILQKQTRKTNNPTNNTLTDSRRLYAQFKSNQYNHTTNNCNNGEYNAEKCRAKSYKTNIQSDGGGCCDGRVQSDDCILFGMQRLAGYQQRSDGFFPGDETTVRSKGARASVKARCFASASVGIARAERTTSKLDAWPVTTGTVLWYTK